MCGKERSKRDQLQSSLIRLEVEKLGLGLFSSETSPSEPHVLFGRHSHPPQLIYTLCSRRLLFAACYLQSSSSLHFLLPASSWSWATEQSPRNLSPLEWCTRTGDMELDSKPCATGCGRGWVSPLLKRPLQHSVADLPAMCDCTLLLKWHIGPNPEKLSDMYAFSEIKDYRKALTLPIRTSDR